MSDQVQGMTDQMVKNLSVYNQLRRPPAEALKPIGAGRLKGMTDISPQWRYEQLTAVFGPVGFGWRYEIVALWMDRGEKVLKGEGKHEGEKVEVVAHARVDLFVTMEKSAGEVVWSAAIPGTGGSMFVAAEKYGVHNSDEAYKMAVTDAIGTAAKRLGLGADIYLGLWDGSKYSTDPVDLGAARKGLMEDAKEIFANGEAPNLRKLDGWDEFNALADETYKGKSGVKDLREAQRMASEAGWDQPQLFGFAKGKGIDLEGGKAKTSDFARLKFEIGVACKTEA